MTEQIAKLSDAELSYLAESGARISEEATRSLVAEVLELRQENYNMAGELNVLYPANAELMKIADGARAFINRRPEVITAIENCPPGKDADYWRWQGHAEAMKNLARDLGLTVPHKPGETTEPVTPKEATTNA